MMRSTNRTIALFTTLAALTLAASPAAAQAKKETKPVVKHETEAQLKAEARITPAAAKATALAAVPRGWVKSSELEREGGKLLYTFDIATKGKSGIDEVHVDAITGAVLSNAHETPAMEKKEAKADVKEKQAALKKAMKVERRSP